MYIFCGKMALREKILFHCCKLLRNTAVLPSLFITYTESRTYSNFCMGVKIHPKSVKYNIPFKIHRYYSEINPNVCWSCGSGIDNNLFCFKCNKLQKIKEKSNYFKVMGVSEHFDLNTKEVTQRYRHLQTLLHPDKFATKSEEEKKISLDWSSLLNKAYSVLQNPLKRGLHLLELNGDSIDQEQTNPELLARILMKYEEAEAASSSEDINKLHEINQSTLQELINNLSLTFQKGDFAKAKELLLEMKYYESIHKDLKEKLEQINV